MFAPVYFDHNATTPLHPAVLAGMLPWLERQFGNASSRHEYGRAARQAIDEARQQVAAAFGAHPTEIVFTSGGSEANNLFLKGAAACLKPGRIAVSAIEHPCILRPAEQLQRQGWQLDQLAVDARGVVDLELARTTLAARPRLVSVMLANNETGALQPVCEIAALSRAAGAFLHSDAVQAAGKVPLDFRELNQAGVHALSLSAHKFGGPKGAGALIIDKRVELAAQIAGGGHERGLRSGTENVPAIVGFGLAAQLAAEGLTERTQRLVALRQRLEAGLRAQGATLFAVDAERLPNTCYFAFPALDGETLVGKLDRAGFAVASGAACSSAHPEPSHVLQAMGVAPALARGAVRISLGSEHRDTDIDQFLVTLQQTRQALSGLTALAA